MQKLFILFPLITFGADQNVDNYKNTFYKYVRSNCIKCHGGTDSTIKKAPPFASPKIDDAYLIAKDYVDLERIDNSIFVIKFSESHWENYDKAHEVVVDKESFHGELTKWIQQSKGLITTVEENQSHVEEEVRTDVKEEFANFIPIKVSDFVYGSTTLQKIVQKDTQLQDFEIMDSEVTWKMLDEFWPDSQLITCFTGDFLITENHPVECITYEQINSFAKIYTEAMNDGYLYRLPTTEEWEFAARGISPNEWTNLVEEFKRAGTLDLPVYYFSTREEEMHPDLEDFGWYKDNSSEGYFKNQTHVIKSRKPNNFGLYDMIGNVREWTSTPIEGRLVIRGCSAEDLGVNLRTDNVDWEFANEKSAYMGFRLVRVPKK